MILCYNFNQTNRLQAKGEHMTEERTNYAATPQPKPMTDDGSTLVLPHVKQALLERESTIDHMATQGASAEDFDVFLSSIEDDYEWIRRGC